MKVEVQTPIKRSGRVQQIEGMFDVPPEDRTELSWETPDELDQLVSDLTDWNVGLIVGPSGSGKTTVARELLGAGLITEFDWPDDEAVVDAISAPIKETVDAFTAVGFGSPPAWLRPYRVLSTGEQFRATLARALLEHESGVFGLDEFTSTVDRQVGQIGSYAVAKAVRKRGQRFVAVTCHDDVIDWLQPDWTYRPDTNQLARRHLQRRPEVVLEIRGVSREAWAAFRHHHYLSPDLHFAAKCIGAFVGNECAAFLAYYRFPHPRAKDIMVCHRIVTLPDYQGLGIGGALLDWTGEWLRREHGDRFHITLAHPGLIRRLRRSPRWEEGSANAPSRSRKPKRLVKQHASARKLATRSFRYVPVI